MPVRFTEKYYKEIQTELETYFYDLFWADILAEVQQSARLYNSRSALLEAIRAGKVHYETGTFTGTFNITLIKELSKFAKYDGRKKIWLGIPPSEIIAASTVANDRGRKIAERINTLIDDIPNKVNAVIGELKYSIDTPLFMMSQEADKDLSSLGITVDITPELSERLIKDYTTNMDLNIKNWTDDEVVRLREMIQKNALSGYNRIELQESIAAEYGVTMNKAHFLARNETSLFTAAVRDSRYQAAGVTKYKWSSSHDTRVRDLHSELNGQIFSYSSPPIIDERTGQRGNPGETYNCRCSCIPIIT